MCIDTQQSYAHGALGRNCVLVTCSHQLSGNIIFNSNGASRHATPVLAPFLAAAPCVCVFSSLAQPSACTVC